MTALQGMKQEKRTLEDRLALVTARAEHNQETSRREERLMLSAMYEVRHAAMMAGMAVYHSCSNQTRSQFISSFLRLLTSTSSFVNNLPTSQLGLHVMDKKIQDLSAADPLSPSDQTPHTVLGVQRARIEQLSLSGGNVGQYTMTGPGSPSGPAATGAALGILSSSSASHTTPVKH